MNILFILSISLIYPITNISVIIRLPLESITKLLVDMIKMRNFKKLYRNTTTDDDAVKMFDHHMMSNQLFIHRKINSASINILNIFFTSLVLLFSVLFIEIGDFIGIYFRYHPYSINHSICRDTID